MMRLLIVVIALSLPAAISSPVFGQDPSAKQIAEAEEAFNKGNAAMEKRKPAEALTHYKQALAILPQEPAILFNAGMAAFGAKDFTAALDFWKQMKELEPSDWHVRSKLIQTYQALGKTAERDTERAELFAMWKKGEPQELKQEFEYCRDQFEVNGHRVMAFEHFELKGDRALRYVFSILDATEQAEDWRISLGSYNTTNAIWRETHKPKPKEGERLFHLDGYFKGGGHATYGMYFPEPTYDETRAIVVKILEGKTNPVSTSRPGAPAKSDDKPKP